MRFDALESRPPQDHNDGNNNGDTANPDLLPGDPAYAFVLDNGGGGVGLPDLEAVDVTLGDGSLLVRGVPDISVAQFFPGTGVSHTYEEDLGILWVVQDPAVPPAINPFMSPTYTTSPVAPCNTQDQASRLGSVPPELSFPRPVAVGEQYVTIVPDADPTTRRLSVDSELHVPLESTGQGGDMRFDISTGAGSAEARQVGAAALRIATASGKIAVGHVTTEKLSLFSSDGDIAVADTTAASAPRIQAIHGDIVVDDSTAPRWDLGTVSGTVTTNRTNGGVYQFVHPSWAPYSDEA